MRALVLAALIALVGLVAPASAAEAPIPPAPTRWVTDQAGLLSPEARATMDAQLEAYERATGHQVVVWIGQSIGGAPLDDWAVRTFAAWKLGQKGKDDGLAIFVLAQDRLIDIEVGYGLEGSVPDAIASRLIRDAMAPRLRAGQADAAIQAGVDGVLTAIEGKPFPGPGRTSAPPEQRAPQVGPGQMILFGVLAVAFLILFITNPRLAMWLLWSIMARGGGGGGGGDRDGGFHGGGGRSGGGGARGGW